MLESRGGTINSNLSKPPLFEKPAGGLKNKEGGSSVRDGSQSSKQPNFTFADDTLPQKSGTSNGGDSLMRDSLHKVGSKSALKTVTLAHSEKKVFVKKELTHHVVIKNEKLLIQALTPSQEKETNTAFGIAVLPTGHNTSKNVAITGHQKSLTRDPTQPDLQGVSRNQNPFGLRKNTGPTLTSLQSDFGMRKTAASSLYSPNNEKRQRLQEWLSQSGSISKTALGSEIYHSKKNGQEGAE